MHRTIAIHYYLKSPGGNYATVDAYIETLGTWAHIHESLWFVRTTKTVSEIRDELAARLRTQDRILAVEVTGDSWASSNLNDDVNEWMHTNMETVRRAA
jgi:hypothetical protein